MEGLERILGDLLSLRESKLGNKRGADREASLHFHWDRNTMSLWTICKEMILKLCFQVRLCKDEEQKMGKKGAAERRHVANLPHKATLWMRKILQMMHWRSDQSIQRQQKEDICQEVTGKKEQDMVNCFHSWLAGWEDPTLRFKAQFT